MKPIIKNYEFQIRKTYQHHDNESVFIHSLKVSILSYKIAKKLKMDYNSAAIGGLLHDFYSEPWLIDGKINNKKSDKKISSKHGFAHAKDALNNSKTHFDYLLNKKTENIILRHMFPLNITPPRYLEAWIVTIVDKYISLSIFKNPKELPKYIGIKIKK